MRAARACGVHRLEQLLSLRGGRCSLAEDGRSALRRVTEGAGARGPPFQHLLDALVGTIDPMSIEADQELQRPLVRQRAELFHQDAHGLAVGALRLRRARVGEHARTVTWPWSCEARRQRRTNEQRGAPFVEAAACQSCGMLRDLVEPPDPPTAKRVLASASAASRESNAISTGAGALGAGATATTLVGRA